MPAGPAAAAAVSVVAGRESMAQAEVRVIQCSSPFILT